MEDTAEEREGGAVDQTISEEEHSSVVGHPAVWSSGWGRDVDQVLGEARSCEVKRGDVRSGHIR